MKILILRGGTALRRRAGSPRASPSTHDRGVMALGNGQGQWVLINVSPAVALQLDGDVRLARHPGLTDAPARAVLQDRPNPYG